MKKVTIIHKRKQLREVIIHSPLTTRNLVLKIEAMDLVPDIFDFCAPLTEKLALEDSSTRFFIRGELMYKVETKDMFVN